VAGFRLRSNYGVTPAFAEGFGEARDAEPRKTELPAVGRRWSVTREAGKRGSYKARRLEGKT